MIDHRGGRTAWVALTMVLILALARGAPAQGPIPAPAPLPRVPSLVSPSARPPGMPPSDPAAAGAPGPAGASGPAVRPAEPLRSLIPIGPAPGADRAEPGLPPTRGRPRPGSVFDPGATGPGISQSGEENFLDGALDPRTGWPFVFLDHFRPRPDRVAAFWVVRTRECPQEMGSDPWPCLQVLHFDDRGELQQRHPAELLAQTVGRPVLIQVQGSLTTPDIALGGLLWTHSWLEYNRVMLRRTVVIAFDWPSQRVYSNDVRDINEKGRRAFVAAYHLARFVQAFPPGSRLCLLGQSYGGRVVPSALHLLGGGALNSMAHDPEVRLPIVRDDLHVRAIIIAGASDHDWLNPGRRLDRALVASEAFLNLYNRRDEALRLYPGLVRSGHRHAIGKLGLKNRDFQQLGPLAARYAEHDVHDILGREHTLLDAVANPKVARMMAPYLFNPNPEPSPEQFETRSRSDQLNRGGRFRPFNPGSTAN